MTDLPTQEPPAPHATARVSGLVVTNLTKLGGLAIAINEALIRTDPRPVALAVAAFMMAGAQGAETFLEKFLGTK